MMDLHADEHGYEEVLPPYLVNRMSMTGTGQLPKFEEDAFKIREEDYFLIPTAEVPFKKMNCDEILEAIEIPNANTSYRAYFRLYDGPDSRTNDDLKF